LPTEFSLSAKYAIGIRFSISVAVFFAFHKTVHLIASTA
jgi:hypothetical protein